MQVLQILLIILPLIADFAMKAEKVYSGVGKGVVKKQFVRASVLSFLKGMGFFTDVAKGFEEQVAGILDKAIDFTVSVINLSGSWSQDIHWDLKEGDKLV